MSDRTSSDRTSSDGDAAVITRVSLDDLPVGAMRRLAHPPYDVLLVHAASGVFAIEDACPHSGMSLALGTLDGEVVTCPGHGWQIDLRSGNVLTEAGAGLRAPQFQVTLEARQIIIRKSR